MNTSAFRTVQELQETVDFKSLRSTRKRIQSLTSGWEPKALLDVRDRLKLPRLSMGESGAAKLVHDVVDSATVGLSNAAAFPVPPNYQAQLVRK